MDPERHQPNSLEQKRDHTPRTSDSALHQVPDDYNGRQPRTTRYANPIFPRPDAGRPTQMQANTPYPLDKHTDGTGSDSPQERNFGLSSREGRSRDVISQNGRRFVGEIPEEDYQACYQWILKNPQILRETDDESNYYQTGIAELRGGNKPVARRCAERYVIRRGLANKTDRQVEEFFYKLQEKEPQLLRYIQTNVASTWAAIEDAVLGKGKQPAETGKSIPKPTYSQQGRRYSYSSGRSNEDDDKLTYGMSQMSVDNSSENRKNRHKDASHAQNDGTLSRSLSIGVPGGLENIPESRPFQHGSKRSIDRGGFFETGDVNHDTGSQKSQRSQNPSLGPDSIDKRFIQRKGKAANEFWCEGRVFARIWHGEDTGTHSRDEVSEWRTTTPKGQVILSHVARMAVVKVGKGFVWAVPINTYNFKGVGKRGFKPVHIEAHAIIHGSDQDPAYADEHEPPMKKLPIAIDLAENQKLHKASRINFAKVHTVEWNVRAMMVGAIASRSKGHFKTYWREHKDE